MRLLSRYALLSVTQACLYLAVIAQLPQTMRALCPLWIGQLCLVAPSLLLPCVFRLLELSLLALFRAFLCPDPILEFLVLLCHLGHQAFIQLYHFSRLNQVFLDKFVLRTQPQNLLVALIVLAFEC